MEGGAAEADGGVAAALSGKFDKPALLIWVAVSYMVLLLADTFVALHMSGKAGNDRE